MRPRIEAMTRAALVTAAAALISAALAGPASAVAAGQDPLRVCADPNNLPFSNKAGEGFENKLAEIVADELGKDGVAYTWWPQRRGFIRNTLRARKCDVVMGVPALDMIATTRPYYRSTFVFVSRASDELHFSSIEAPELRHLRIGVHLIGDDGANTPPAHALGEQGIVDNVVGYTVYGDYREESPPSRLVLAVAQGEVDVAAAWGPRAGYYAMRSPVALKVTPITDTIAYLPLVFQYSISMGVRKEDEALKERLNEAIVERRDEIQALLDRYGVPRL